MRIYVNGESTDVPEGCTAAQLVERLGFGGQRIAIEVNREIVTRSTYEAHVFRPDDRVEVVRAIGGG